MKKFVLVMVLFSAIYLPVSGQAYEDDIQYDKKKQQGVAIEYSFPAEALENAFIEKMKKLGYKPKEEKGIFNRDKGFLVFKNAYVTEISKDRLDYVIKVEKKKKDSESSVLYMLMMKGEENAFQRLASTDIGKAKLFLVNLLPEVEAAHLELQIRDQEESLANAEKKLRSLQAEKEELEKKLVENLKTQDEKIKEIESHKLSLETLKGKRKKD